MRCDEVAQELSAPTGRLDRSAMAVHLAACPRCAAWLEKMEKLDRIWEATRPAEPTGLAFDQLWSNVNRSLEVGMSPELADVASSVESPIRETIPFDPDRRGSRRWRLAVAVLAPLAAAAVLLLAILPTGSDGPAPGDPGRNHQANWDGDVQSDPQVPVEVALTSFEFDQGGVSIIHIGEDGPPRIEEHPLMPVSDTETIAASFEMLNYVETLSDPQGAF